MIINLHKLTISIAIVTRIVIRRIGLWNSFFFLFFPFHDTFSPSFIYIFSFHFLFYLVLILYSVRFYSNSGTERSLLSRTTRYCDASNYKGRFDWSRSSAIGWGHGFSNTLANRSKQSYWSGPKVFFPLYVSFYFLLFFFFLFPVLFSSTGIFCKRRVP